jgi:SAM-dependent methyltransferase
VALAVGLSAFPGGIDLLETLARLVTTTGNRTAVPGSRSVLAHFAIVRLDDRLGVFGDERAGAMTGIQNARKSIETLPCASSTAGVDRYLAIAVQEGLWSSQAALRTYLTWLFEGVPLAERRVLDIGGGTGIFSLYAAVMGAANVICLEPEEDGGSVGMNERLTRLQHTAGIDRVRLVRETFQNFTAQAGSFDVVLLHNSVNHLDEHATMRLRDSTRARDVYRDLFRKAGSLLAADGRVLIADCARTNLFPLLHLPHPISRSIEWHKHQNPGLWAGVLREAGFTDPVVGWSSYNHLGPLGWALFANKLGAFFLTGHFRLLMRKTATSESLK